MDSPALSPTLILSWSPIVDQVSIIIALILAAALALFVVFSIIRMIVGIISAWREHRAAEARRITLNIPGLGEFTSTDNELWFGSAQDTEICIHSPGQPPTEVQVRKVQGLLAKLPDLIERATAWLRKQEKWSDFIEGDNSAPFEPYAIELRSASEFVLEMVHPADVDVGVYRIDFTDSQPTSWTRDD